MIGSVDVGRDEFSALISPDSPVITISWCSSCRVQQRKRGARDSLVVLTTTKRNALCVCGAHSCVCVISSENNTSVRVENDKNLIIFWVFFQIKKKKHCFLCVDLVWWWPHRNYIVIFFSTLNWNEIPHGKHNINCRYGELRNFCFSFFLLSWFLFFSPFHPSFDGSFEYPVTRKGYYVSVVGEKNWTNKNWRKEDFPFDLVVKNLFFF
jgi:hypothetical protein